MIGGGRHLHHRLWKSLYNKTSPPVGSGNTTLNPCREVLQRASGDHLATPPIIALRVVKQVGAAAELQSVTAVLDVLLVHDELVDDWGGGEKTIR